MMHGKLGELHHSSWIFMAKSPTSGQECLQQCNTICLARKSLDSLDAAFRKHSLKFPCFSLLSTKPAVIAKRRREGTIQSRVVHVFRNGLETH